MPRVRTKTQEEYNAYHRAWTQKQKDAFYSNKSCQVCGSDERLEIDHIDPEKKIDNNIWNWAIERRLEELSKCRVLCHDCHVQRHVEDGTFKRSGLLHGRLGENGPNAKLKESQVRRIRLLVALGLKSQRGIAKELGLAPATVNQIIKMKRWRHISEDPEIPA